MTGYVRIIGLGPGTADWLTPEAAREIEAASDVIGYIPYVERLQLRQDQVAHVSDNRVELDRARSALDLALSGRQVAIVSGGDPGIFAMAAAVYEAIDHGPAAWRALDVSVVPGISAMQAAAARLGAPLGHDFCVVSLSDNLKPWGLIKKRLAAAADGDFVLALYNPASKARPDQIRQAFDLLRQRKDPRCVVIIARAVGRLTESITISSLSDVDASLIDMSSLVIIGSSQTRCVDRAAKRPFVYTPRSAPLQ